MIGSDHQQSWKVTADDRQTDGFRYAPSIATSSISLASVQNPPCSIAELSTLAQILMSTSRAMEILIQALPSSSGIRLTERIKFGHSSPSSDQGLIVSSISVVSHFLSHHPQFSILMQRGSTWHAAACISIRCFRIRCRSNCFYENPFDSSSIFT